jgi:hypothetical protein
MDYFLNVTPLRIIGPAAAKHIQSQIRVSMLMRIAAAVARNGVVKKAKV